MLGSSQILFSVFYTNKSQVFRTVIKLLRKHQFMTGPISTLYNCIDKFYGKIHNKSLELAHSVSPEERKKVHMTVKKVHRLICKFMASV